MHSLQTARLLLRQWQSEDADFVFDLYSRWEVQRFIGSVPQVMEDRSDAVQRLARLQGLEDAIHGSWAVERLDNAHLVGTILLKDIPASGDLPLRASGDTEIGWHFHPDSWGRGYASEAASAILAHGFEAGLPRIVAVTAPENFASQRVCTRIGMTHQGKTSAYYNASCELFVATTSVQ